MAREVVVRFSRPQADDGLSYEVSVDDGPRAPFQNPWRDNELDMAIETLRNANPETRPPQIDQLTALGKRLGAELAKVPAIVGALHDRSDGDLVVFWQLDYPQLARLPWELATWWTPPHHHILLERDITFVRTVPLFNPRLPTEWPTGRKRAPRVLFVWAERPPLTVPHEIHLERLEQICEETGCELVAREVRSISDLTEIAGGDSAFDFVHILAHGTPTGKKNGEERWGLQFVEEDVEGAQVARALTAGDSTPAMVTLAACDSAGEPSASFSSVAYELQAHGIPLIVGSQFRLRKSVSALSAAEIYDSVLAGGHPFDALSALRRQLSPNNNEAWSNEVLYSNYTCEALEHGARVARQQAALRRARVLTKRHSESGLDEAQTAAAIDELREQIDRLDELVHEGFDLPETYGLLGSMARRIAYIRCDPPDEEDLRDALDYYERGVEADLNSHYCGINAIHLSLLLDEPDRAAPLLPVVRYRVDRELKKPEADYWAWATSGELSVYAGDRDGAVEAYRQFVRRERDAVPDPDRQAAEIRSAGRQLDQFVALAGGQPADSPERDAVIDAAQAARKLLADARSRISTTT